MAFSSPTRRASYEAIKRRLGSARNPTYTAMPIDGRSQYRTGPYKAQPVEGGRTYGDPTGQPRSSPVDSTRPNYENVDQFDFNRNYEDQLDQFQRSRADLAQKHDLFKQRLNEDFGRQTRDVRNAQTESLNLDAEKMAGQGILRSGIAVKSAGEIGSRYGNELDSLQRSLSGQLEDAEGTYAQSQRQIQEQIGRTQEGLTRRQQELEKQRARQFAAAEAAQRAAQAAAKRSAEKQKAAGMLVKDNRGKYFMVDPTNKTRQLVNEKYVDEAEKLYGPAITGLEQAGSHFGSEYIKNANALARRLGGDLGGNASLDVRLGFRDLGHWRR